MVTVLELCFGLHSQGVQARVAGNLPLGSPILAKKMWWCVNNQNHHREPQEPAGRRPGWRRLHHSPLFWMGAFLFLAAITIYVLTDDLSWRPRLH